MRRRIHRRLWLARSRLLIKGWELELPAMRRGAMTDEERSAVDLFELYVEGYRVFDSAIRRHHEDLARDIGERLDALAALIAATLNADSPLDYELARVEALAAFLDCTP